MKITIGQYYPSTSIIHSLDPRIKLMSTIVLISTVFLIGNFLGYAFAAAFLWSVIKTSTVPPRYLLRGLRAIMFIIVFTVLLNMFFSPGERVVLHWSFLRLTVEGLVLAGQRALRLVMLVIGSSILTLTTTPIELTDAIEFGLAPLKKIGVPAHEIAMMMTIALRFIPTLVEEMDKIMKAQMARGASFDTGGIIKKAKAMIPLLVPLFISSFRRADELALAMEARCYRGDVGRTRMKQMRFAALDYKAMAVLFLFIVAIIGLNFLGDALNIW